MFENKSYRSMIIPYFDYGDMFYRGGGVANQEGLDKLQRLQISRLEICKRVDVRFDMDELHSVTKTSSSS